MSFLTVQELEYSVSVPAVMNILFWHSGHPLISLILGPNHTAWAPQAHALDTNRPNMYILTLLEQKHKPNEEKIKLQLNDVHYILGYTRSMRPLFFSFV